MKHSLVHPSVRQPGNSSLSVLLHDKYLMHYMITARYVNIHALFTLPEALWVRTILSHVTILTLWLDIFKPADPDFRHVIGRADHLDQSL